MKDSQHFDDDISKRRKKQHVGAAVHGSEKRENGLEIINFGTSFKLIIVCLMRYEVKLCWIIRTLHKRLACT